VKTTVVNLRKSPFDVYLGRPGNGRDGCFGNPFMIGRDGTREEVIQKYRRYFEHRLAVDPEFRERVLDLRGKRPGCFCKPDRCHGDVIAEWLDSLEESSR
jgi:hypothetical protein